MAVTIRPALSTDADAIYNIHVSSIQQLCCTHYDQGQILTWAGRQKVERYVSLMKEKDHTFVVAEIDNKVVGFANFYDDHEKQQIEIEGLYVSPTCVRQGIGSSLVRYAEAKATQNKYKTLTVVATLNAAESFYPAQGFTAIAECTHATGELSLRAVAMLKQLAG